MKPHLEPLRDVFNFTIESQILYHAPLSFEPAYGPVPPQHIALPSGVESPDAVEIVKDELSGNVDEAWQVGEEEMKVFVNSEKWSLGESCWMQRMRKTRSHSRFGQYEQPCSAFPLICAERRASAHASFGSWYVGHIGSSEQAHGFA